MLPSKHFRFCKKAPRVRPLRRWTIAKSASSEDGQSPCATRKTLPSATCGEEKTLRCFPFTIGLVYPWPYKAWRSWQQLRQHGAKNIFVISSNPFHRDRNLDANLSISLTAKRRDSRDVRLHPGRKLLDDRGPIRRVSLPRGVDSRGNLLAAARPEDHHLYECPRTLGIPVSDHGAP